jgi:hypothetical protein
MLKVEGYAGFFQRSEIRMGFENFKGFRIYTAFLVLSLCIIEIYHQSFTLAMAAGFSTRH